jgi:NDP-sugar pyrophosphorylase family protein
LLNTSEIQAVILAGGLGTRMRPWTETVPKPLIPVARKPFLQHQVELLVRHGVCNIVLLVAYLGEQIEQFFGDGVKFGCHIAYSYEGAPMGTGGALRNAEARLASQFLLINGDTYLDLPYAKFARDFRAGGSAALVAAYRPGPERSSLPADKVACNLALDATGKVLIYRKRHPEGLTHVDAGVIGLRKTVLDKIPAGVAYSLEEKVFPQLIAEGQMRAWVTEEPFYDMGSPEGLEALAKKLT